MGKYKFKIRLLPVIAFTAVVFLIVKARSFRTEIKNMPDIPLESSTQMWDVFSYVKASAILFIAVWAALTMAYLLITGQMKIKKTFIYIPMLVYTLGVAGSYIMSEYQWIAWYGGVNRFEGTRTILCYMFMLFYTINVVDELRDVMILVSTTLAGVFLACLIGMSQLLGCDFFLSGVGKYLLTGGGMELEGQFLPGQVYQTVANMNYVGMYLSLVVPVLVYILIYINLPSGKQKLKLYAITPRKRLVITVFSGLLLLLIILNVYGAGSLGGLLGICVSLVLLLVVLCKKKYLKPVIAFGMLIGIIGGLWLVYAQGVDQHKQLDYIETEIDCVKMSIDGSELTIYYDRSTDRYGLLDPEGQAIPTFTFAGEDGRYQVADDRFEGKVVVIPFKDVDGVPCFVADLKDEEFAFIFYEDGAKYYNPFGRQVSQGRVDSLGFEGHLMAGNSRGYIWSRSLPLIKDCVFLGTGADSFMMIFPQGDYAGKYSSDTPLQTTCDKAHSMYLNMALGTGVISLIAFVSMILMTMWMVGRLGREQQFVKVIASGIIGFLFAGLFNDSGVSIMPMFYGLLGTVIAMCILARRTENEQRS